MVWSRKQRLEQRACLGRGEDTKGVVICNCKCGGGCVAKRQLLGLVHASLSLWSFLTCTNFLQTPDTPPRKLWHPRAAPGLFWLLRLGSPVRSPGPYGSPKLPQASIHPCLLRGALPDLSGLSSASCRLRPFCTSG